jgi:hypothetical protein
MTTKLGPSYHYFFNLSHFYVKHNIETESIRVRRTGSILARKPVNAGHGTIWYPQNKTKEITSVENMMRVPTAVAWRGNKMPK